MAIVFVDVDASWFVWASPSQIVDRAKAASPDMWLRKAWDAFMAGENYEPPRFAYGLAAGNYQTDLVSIDGILYHVHRLSGYRQKLVAIAKNEETERVAYLKANCGEAT